MADPCLLFEECEGLEPNQKEQLLQVTGGSKQRSMGEQLGSQEVKLSVCVFTGFLFLLPDSVWIKSFSFRLSYFDC